MQIEDGQVHLFNQTVLEQNTAPVGGGKSIHLIGGALQYELPAPPGRYLFIPQGAVFHLAPGAVDSDFPYACPAGVVGGSSVREQSGPECSRPW